MKHLPTETDSSLVEAVRKGDRSAFRTLVERYQSLVCGVAYALTGNASESEEIAQEVFIAVWRQMPRLEEAVCLRSWINAIVRNLSLRWRRDNRRGSDGPASSGLAQEDVASEDASPLDRMIEREESDAVWQALRAIPEIYRIPLVLFYREQRSVEKVAKVLDLSESSVKWRLWRGRRILHDRMAIVVEKALSCSRPGTAFTAAVIAGLSLGKVSAASAAALRIARLERRATPVLAASFPAAALSLAVVLGAATLYASARGPSGKSAAGLARTETHGAPNVSTRANVMRALTAARSTAEGWPIVGKGATPLGPSLIDLSGADGPIVFGFEDAVLPDHFGEGHVARCPPRAGNAYCLVGTVIPWIGDRNAVEIGFRPPDDRTLFRFAPEATISFDYWLGTDGSRVSLAVSNERTRINYWFDVPDPVRGTWAHARMKLRELTSDAGSRGFREATNKADVALQPGDGLRWLRIFGGRVGGEPFFVDNIELSPAR